MALIEPKKSPREAPRSVWLPPPIALNTVKTIKKMMYVNIAKPIADNKERTKGAACFLTSSQELDRLAGLAFNVVIRGIEELKLHTTIRTQGKATNIFHEEKPQ